MDDFILGALSFVVTIIFIISLLCFTGAIMEENMDKTEFLAEVRIDEVFSEVKFNSATKRRNVECFLKCYRLDTSEYITIEVLESQYALLKRLVKDNINITVTNYINNDSSIYKSKFSIN